MSGWVGGKGQQKNKIILKKPTHDMYRQNSHNSGGNCKTHFGKLVRMSKHLFRRFLIISDNVKKLTY